MQGAAELPRGTLIGEGLDLRHGADIDDPRRVADGAQVPEREDGGAAGLGPRDRCGRAIERDGDDLAGAEPHGLGAQARKVRRRNHPFLLCGHTPQESCPSQGRECPRPHGRRLLVPGQAQAELQQVEVDVAVRR